jgi:hypothetical protein
LLLEREEDIRKIRDRMEA